MSRRYLVSKNESPNCNGSAPNSSSSLLPPGSPADSFPPRRSAHPPPPPPPADGRFSPPPPGHDIPVFYGKCMKSHTTGFGNYVTDGCLLFVKDAWSTACAACGCDKTYHEEINGLRAHILAPPPALN